MKTISDLELACLWAMKMGFATGHASTLADLLDEIEWQLQEREEDWRLEMKELRESQ